MKSVTLVVPGPLDTCTGGTIYDRRIADALSARGWDVAVVELDPFMNPLAPPLASVAPRFATIPDDRLVLVDGLAFGTIPEVIVGESRRLRLVPIIHMPLGSTPGLAADESTHLVGLERRALACARHVVITGNGIRSRIETMLPSRADIPVTCIPPGVDRVAPPQPAKLATSSPRLLSVANVTWGKGFDILVRALATVKEGEWTLTCVGSIERAPDYVADARNLVRELGLEPRITWTGELKDPSPAFASADLFVLPTRGETYGMAVAEAIAHGVPVISTRTGEIPEIVGGGGLLAEPGDEDAFARLLRTAIGRADLRDQLASAAQEAARRLPTWDAAADALAVVLAAVSRG